MTIIQGFVVAIIVATWAALIVGYTQHVILPRFKVKRTPIFCAYHAYKASKRPKRKWQLAIIDPSRCEICMNDDFPKDAA